jgi:D-lactate dehydrogenase
MGFGCTVLVYDVLQNLEALSYGVEYVSLDEIWATSDFISRHAPRMPSTKHMSNAKSIA